MFIEPKKAKRLLNAHQHVDLKMIWPMVHDASSMQKAVRLHWIADKMEIVPLMGNPVWPMKRDVAIRETVPTRDYVVLMVTNVFPPSKVVPNQPNAKNKDIAPMSQDPKIGKPPTADVKKTPKDVSNQKPALYMANVVLPMEPASQR